MVVVMKERATEAQIDSVIARLIELGMDVHRSSGATLRRSLLSGTTLRSWSRKPRGHRSAGMRARAC